jgi:hypothetical protein
VVELADKYNMPMVMSACEGFLSTRQLGQGKADANDVVKWLATADRLGLRAVIVQCVSYLKNSKCLQGLQLIQVYSAFERDCNGGHVAFGAPCAGREDCLKKRLVNKAYFAQLSHKTLLQLLFP